MFYLVWQMGFLLLIAFGIGLFFGRQIWGGDARALEADEAIEEASRLRRENENLARRLGEAEAASAQAAPVMPPATTPAEPKKAEPTSEVESKPSPVEERANAGGDDDLTRIKGLGPKAAASLQAGGVTRFAQIADWTEVDVAAWDEKINGRGRIIRDDWVAQAKDLA